MANDSDEKSLANTADNRIGLHPDALKLGLVSLLTDFSSEMIFSVFAIFFTTIAGATAALLGLIEGLADLSASSLNYLSGWLADRTGSRQLQTKRTGVTHSARTRRWIRAAPL